MIGFRSLPDDHPDLTYSPLLRAAQLTLHYLTEAGPIGLTKSKAFNRKFVHWAVEHFDWPNRGAEDVSCFHRVLNEYDFPPLELLHFLLAHLKLGRHYKGEFRPTKKGRDLADQPGMLFKRLVPFFLFEVDHASYGRFDDPPRETGMSGST